MQSVPPRLGSRTDSRTDSAGRTATADLARYNAATAGLEPPFAVVDLAALRANAPP